MSRGRQCYGGRVQAWLHTRFTRARRGLRQRLTRVARRIYLALALASPLLFALPGAPKDGPFMLAALAFVSFIAL